jgi:hypothetical protein
MREVVNEAGFISEERFLPCKRRERGMLDPRIVEMELCMSDQRRGGMRLPAPDTTRVESRPPLPPTAASHGDDDYMTAWAHAVVRNWEHDQGLGRNELPIDPSWYRWAAVKLAKGWLRR